MAQIAKRCGLSRQHLYNLMRGNKAPPEWTVHKIARGLRLPVDVVAKAFAKTAEQRA
jgi:DNA-binding phage protein